jgi:hypothetical protein
MNHSLRIVTILLAASCTDELEDGRDDVFIVDGKTDTGGITEGSPEAAAVLELANTTSRADLGGEIGLAVKAADNIAAVRDGDDGNAGTSDDARFSTLAQLDAVPFVGPQAFGKLLQYARDNDLIGDGPTATDDPFDPAACSGAPMTMAAARARPANLGSYQLTIRSRRCTGTTCTAWAPVPIGELEWPQDASGTLSLGNYSGEIRLVAKARTCDAILSSNNYIVGSVCDGIGHQLQCSTYNEPSDCRTSHEVGLRMPDGTYARFEGKLAEHCVQLISHRTYEGATTRYETQTAILERF